MLPITGPITEQELQDINGRIQELRNKKVRLLEKYGIFGGGQEVNKMHEEINEELELLGVQP